MAKQYEVETRFEPLHSSEADDAYEDEEIDNPLTRAAKKQISDEEGGKDELDIDEQIEDEPEDEDGEDEDQPVDEDEEESPPEEDEDDEDESYSKKVRKRILREKKRADKFQTQLTEVEARLARQEARWEAEADEKKLSEKRQSAEEKLAEIREKKKTALEEGDTDQQIELDEQILDIKADLRQAEREAKEARQRLDESKRTGEVIDGIDIGKLPAKSREWIDAHPQFRTDAKFRRAALAATSYLEQKGLNYQTDTFWKKLETELSEDFPDYFKKKASVRRKPAATTVGSRGTGRSPEADRKRGKVRITAEDKRNMERFNLDPNNRDHVREYAAAKLTS